MLKHLEPLSKEVEQLLEALKSKQKGSVIEIRNTEVEKWLYYRGFVRVINAPNKYHHDCLFPIPMSYVKGVEEALKEINHAIRWQR